MAELSFSQPVAQNRQGRFATTPWGERFERLLESAHDQDRLIRGRVHARDGSIQDVNVQPGGFKATVAGDYNKYRISFNLPILEARAWERLAAQVRTQADLKRAVILGQLPPKLVALLDRTSRHWLPTSIRKLPMTCSCADPAKPCKHVAAVCYFLVEQIDRDPSLLLRLLGTSLSEFQALVQIQADPVVTDLSIEGFWAEPKFYVSEENFRRPTQQFALLDQLGPLPSARDTELVRSTLEAVYERVTSVCFQEAVDDPSA